MVIDDRIAAIKRLLDRIHQYGHLIEADSFEPASIDDMKGNAKDLCDIAKAEIGNIKAEIDQWT